METMLSQSATDNPPFTQPSQQDLALYGPTGLKAVFNILDKWHCDAEQKQAILAMGRSTFYKYQEDCSKAKLNRDQLERISYILNIHQGLRIVFANPENVYGFMKMPNHNAFFNGKTPLEIIATGQFANLYEVFKQIDHLRSSLW